MKCRVLAATSVFAKHCLNYLRTTAIFIHDVSKITGQCAIIVFKKWMNIYKQSCDFYTVVAGTCAFCSHVSLVIKKTSVVILKKYKQNVLIL